MWSSAKKKAEEEAENSVEKRLMKQLEYKKENKPPVFITLDEFLVNLPGSGGEHYLQTKLVLRTADASTEKRITEFLPLVRDRVLSVLSARTVSELASVEGKAAMAKDIALVINAIIEPQLTAIFILQQEPSTADLRNLERLGAIPKETAGGGAYSAVAKEAAAQFWKVTEMDLPVQAVLFNALVMQ
jgi:flagellar basal body-associated protein FliL